MKICDCNDVLDFYKLYTCEFFNVNNGHFVLNLINDDAKEFTLYRISDNTVFNKIQSKLIEYNIIPIKYYIQRITKRAKL